MAQFSQEEQDVYTQIFHTMDIDGNGSLSFQEFHRACQKLGLYITDDDVQVAFKTIDVNGNGKVKLTEFMSIMENIHAHHPHAHKKAKVRRTFQNMDKDNDGILSEKELLDGLRHAGYDITKGQVKKVIADIDRNSDGLVQFEEFLQLFDI